MDETIILEKLMGFGMTRQEAVIYLCLYKKGGLTGYEVSKQTGISRSNVYGSLSNLAEAGAAYLVKGSANRYLAVSIEEFCNNKIRILEREKEFLMENMPAADEPLDGYITIEGASNIRNKIITMLEKAQQRIYLSAPGDFLMSIRKELEAVAERKIKLVFITDKDTGIEPTFLYLTDKKEKQIRLIIDSVYVLTGDIAGGKTDTCLYSGQRNFVSVFKEALRNEIKLIELTKGENRNE
ncbi:MAG: TrmB family transcriptional regulator [Lachnospiraceae bacterium]|jgi:sugar-specific transcriptional regulator TrmB|nr:TrmB family transcriptional regulator [Lachnospiraceae bacterium]MCI9106693.1 TrmB family transcriptional regulator [Lachnospiraceae bacterium]MCI9342948.1 TrmB family transcriptional regulator [Lachnospiraceae bacterium]